MISHQLRLNKRARNNAFTNTSLQAVAQTTPQTSKMSSLKRRKKGLLTKDALKSFLAMTKTFGSSFSSSFWIIMKDA